MVRNIYDKKLAAAFRKSDLKPDKQYSFLPTVLNIVGDLAGKDVLDLGCGDGFFSIAMANSGAEHIVGIDNSPDQIRLANEKVHPENITYQLGDIYKDTLPSADIVLCPFVANYAQSVKDLAFLFENIYKALDHGGKALFLVDLFKGNNLKKFGSIKTLQGPPRDGTVIKIDLYNRGAFICSLYSHYYTPATLEKTLEQEGFKNIDWHKPIISNEGLKTFGESFWKDYPENSEVGYLSAEKH